MHFALPEPVLDALRRLASGGHEAYLVGGCVRDDCLGIQPKDYDICTSAEPGQVHACFRGEAMADTGIRHGTVTVILRGMPLEITTFRADLEYRDGRHPDGVVFTRSLAQDLSRRDFTINAMAWHMDTGIIDLYGGLEDCRLRRIVCVGDPQQRFGEDALRILRAMRFASTLGFSISPPTARAMHALKARLNMISRERISAELNGLLAGGRAGETLAEFFDIMAEAVPQAAPGPREAAMAALRHSPPDIAVRWALLFSNCGEVQADEGGYPPEAFRDNASARRTREALISLRATNTLVEQAETLSGLACVRIAPGAVKKWLSRISPDMFDRLIALKRALAAARTGKNMDEAELRTVEDEKARVLRQGLCTGLKGLAVNGCDLAALGFAGSGIGDALERLLDKVLSDEAPNERSALIALAASWRSK